MKREMKNLSGALFKNKDKERETHADYDGTCLIDGVEYWVNCWDNVSKAGNQYFKLSFKRKTEQAERQIKAARKVVQQDAGEDFDDDIPF